MLLVHGEPASLEPLQLALQQEGFTVNEAGWLAELLDYLREPLDSCSPTDLPDLFVADLDTLGSSGSLEVLSAVCSAGAGARLIVLASAPNAALRRQVEELPSALLLEKPCTDDDSATWRWVSSGRVEDSGGPAHLHAWNGSHGVGEH